MIIHTPETRLENGKFIVASRIEFNADYDFPNELWFSVEDKLMPQVSIRSDIFLSTMFRVARAIGEDIDVRGDLSPQLLFGLREYLKIHAAWSGNHNIININAVDPVPATRITQEAAASCNFSGGIDSFYTLWLQLPDKEQAPELQIKYGIYGLGFSSPHNNDFLETTYLPRLQKMLKSLDVDLLVVGSNAQAYAHPDPWLAISTGRLAIAQLFYSMISTHFVPSSISYDTQRPFGTSPLTDHLFSLESLRIFSHASDHIRFEKLREMSSWPIYYDYLQVCNNKRSDILNDCSCRKCIRTMLMANVLGIEDKITTFHIPFRKSSLLRRILTVSNQYLDFKLMALHALRSGKLSLVPFIYFPMLIYKLTNWIKPLLGYRFR